MNLPIQGAMAMAEHQHICRALGEIDDTRWLVRFGVAVQSETLFEFLIFNPVDAVYWLKILVNKLPSFLLQWMETIHLFGITSTQPTQRALLYL
mmetsp:Transcript_11606/g.21567  ORF Transcript_11606/g.21567 Transcript_11606/m.21567 type:complete len:94 (+) Transcript_11606:1459-1740(+)